MCAARVCQRQCKAWVTRAPPTPHAIHATSVRRAAPHSQVSHSAVESVSSEEDLVQRAYELFVQPATARKPGARKGGVPWHGTQGPPATTADAATVALYAALGQKCVRLVNKHHGQPTRWTWCAFQSVTQSFRGTMEVFVVGQWARWATTADLARLDADKLLPRPAADAPQLTGADVGPRSRAWVQLYDRGEECGKDRNRETVVVLRCVPDGAGSSGHAAEPVITWGGEPGLCRYALHVELPRALCATIK